MTKDRKTPFNLSSEEGQIYSRIERLIYAERRLVSVWEESTTPKWLKWYHNQQLIMARVNKAYTRATGISLPAYRGQIDSRIWGEEQGEALNDLDMKVVNRRLSHSDFERLINPKTSVEEVWMVIKEPYMVDDSVIGVWGKGWPIPADLFDAHEEVFRAIPFIH